MTKEEYLNSDFVKMAHLNNQVVYLTQVNRKLEQENKHLKAQIEKMKNCGNCNLYDRTYELCQYSLGDEDYNCRNRKWELA